MTIRPTFHSFLALCCGLMLAGCSSKSSSTTTTTTEAAASTIAGVPKVTGPVTSTSSTLASALGGEGQVRPAATTGLALKAWNKSSRWTTSTSRIMCETGSLMREVLREAMQPDKIACYVGAVQKAGKFSGSTIDDGNYFYFKLQNLPGQTGEPKMKMRIVKTNGAITTFEMFSCFGSGQTEYLLSSITSSDATITSKNIGSENGATYGSSSVVTGKLDADYKWTSKSATIRRTYTDTANSAAFHQSSTISQYASSYNIAGYNKGSWGTGASKNIWTNAFYIAIQAMNTENPKNISLGDGTGKFSMNQCQNPQGGGGTSCTGAETAKYSGTGIQSWNGDTLATLGTASDGAYYATANQGTLPASTPDVTVSFATSETWDCTTAGTFAGIDMSDFATSTSALGAAIAACNEKYEFSADSDAGDGGYVCQNAQ